MYLSLRPSPKERARADSAAAAAQPTERKPAIRKAGKLSFKEQRELESIEDQIEAAEGRKAEAEDCAR
jgi:hypothetical protein